MCCSVTSSDLKDLYFHVPVIPKESSFRSTMNPFVILWLLALSPNVRKRHWSYAGEASGCNSELLRSPPPRFSTKAYFN